VVDEMSDLQQMLVVQFYQQQHQALINYLQSKLGSPQEANDVAQETYERLLNNEQTAVINNPKAFVFRIASNLAIDRIRQRKMRGDDEVGDFDENELISPMLSPDEQIDNELMVAMVRMFISELPAKCRSAFLYYKFEERDYTEIAEMLGVSESMIRKYVLRAVAYCRERLDQCNTEVSIDRWRSGLNGGDQ
jgi:RNA polymerase sigma-70 factor (ECF subfamily)